MAFFLFLGFVILWVYGWIGFSKRFFEKRQSVGKLTRIAFTTVLCIAPFAHELYVYFGFKAYCGVYGGIVQLEPVTTDSLAFNVPEANWPQLLAHPTLHNVKYVGEEASHLQRPIASLSEDLDDCGSILQIALETDTHWAAKALVASAKSRGLCYTDQVQFEEPKYELRKGNGLYQYQESQSIFYPRKVRFTENFELVDRSSETIKSRFLNMETRIGFLMSFLIPQMRHYKCSEKNVQQPSVRFPFDKNVYKFLQHAIVKG